MRRSIVTSVVLLATACGLSLGTPKQSVKDGDACSIDDDCVHDRCQGGYCAGPDCGCGYLNACGTDPQTSDDCHSGWKCLGTVSTLFVTGVCREPCSAGCPSTWTCRENYCVYIPPQPTPPSVTIDSAPDEIEMGVDAGLKGSATTVNGSITSFTWQLGDGATASGTEVSHAWSQVGIITITATATDEASAQSSAQATLRVCLPLGTACYPFDQRGNCCTGKRCAAGADGGTVCQN